MDYPTAVLEKAKRLEQLLQRVAAGEPLDAVNEALGFDLDEEQLAHAQAKYEVGGCRWEALIDGRYGHAQKVHSGIREWLYTRKERDEAVRAPQLAREIKEKFGVEVDPGHINYLLRKRGLTAAPGRPCKKEPAGEETTDAETVPSESIDNAGIFFPGGGEGRHGGGGRD
jgi:transposase